MRFHALFSSLHVFVLVLLAWLTFLPNSSQGFAVDRNRRFPTTTTKTTSRTTTTGNTRTNQASTVSSTTSRRRSRAPSPSQSSPATQWYQRRKTNTNASGSRRITTSRKKPPQWEKEGDDLYQEIIIGSSSSATAIIHGPLSYDQARALLHNVTATNRKAQDTIRTAQQLHKQPDDPTKLDIDTDEADEPPFVWGGLSVGPVWKQRLVQAGFARPTTIQQEAFGAIASSSSNQQPQQRRRSNVIVASPTGSGKTLAYLLPLLTTTTKANKQKLPGTVWILTPTTELALQLQTVVRNLCHHDDDPTKLCQVVQTNQDDDNDIMESTILGIEAPLLMGTPKVFGQLYKELSLRRSASSQSLEGQTKCRELLSNLDTVVLDETDRLLQTEAVARQDTLRKQLKQQQQSSSKSNKKNPKLARLEPTSTEQLLHRLLGFHNNDINRHHNRHSSPPPPPSESRPIRLVCASATVGRTLRRQLMELTQAPNMDATAVLVTDHVRTKKHALQRQAALLSHTLQHQYYVLRDEEKHGHGDSSQDDEQGDNWSLLNQVSELILALSHPAPLLIFPGRTGVRTVQEHLRNALKMTNVGGLEDIALMNTVASSSSSSTDDYVTTYQTWKETPVYVVSEKLGRGLDIEGLRYVLLLQVPSSAAGYTHLTGRTGRNGSTGTAICMCPPRQAPKLCRIAETLGLVMEELLPVQNATGPDDDLTTTTKTASSSTATSGGEVNFPEHTMEDGAGQPEPVLKRKTWKNLSPSALKRKTVADIREYLLDHRVDLTTPMKKVELLDVVEELHSTAS